MREPDLVVRLDPRQYFIFDEFCKLVVPELQRRGLFRMKYEGSTLRENVGLPRPKNRFVASDIAAE